MRARGFSVVCMSLILVVTYYWRLIGYELELLTQKENQLVA
jgi:hypothetical protein